ncbi:MAG: hypothetical protein WBF53_02565 [Litorimonas sp.]
MKTFAQTLASLIFAALALAACGSGGDTVSSDSQAPIDASLPLPEVADRVIVDGERLAELLSSVVDAETAEAAKPQLENLVQTYEDVAQRFETMGEPSMSEVAAIMRRTPQIMAVQTQVAAEITRIYREAPEARAVLESVLDGVDQP